MDYLFNRDGVELSFSVADIRLIHGEMRDPNESGMPKAHGELLMKADDAWTQRLVREFGDVYQVYLERAREKQAAFDKAYGPVKTMEYKVLTDADLTPEQKADNERFRAFVHCRGHHYESLSNLERINLYADFVLVEQNFEPSSTN